MARAVSLEAVFPVVHARAVSREVIGRRVALAVAAMVAGGVALVLDVSSGDGAAWIVAGVAAVAAATLGWANDNTLTRPPAERDPLSVIAAKPRSARHSRSQRR